MSQWHLGLAVRVLREGGLVLHATEGVWGLACDPLDPVAVDDLLELKGRPANKGLILIGASASMFEPELALLDAPARAAVVDSWPGPVTWVLQSNRFPDWITGGRPTVAVRVPGHSQARRLSALFGRPLVSTSANRAGEPPARNRLQARTLQTALMFRRRRPGAVGQAPNQLYLLPGETSGRRGTSEIRSVDGRRLRTT